MCKEELNKIQELTKKECSHPWQYVEVGYDHIDMCVKAICHKCGKITILEK